MDGIVHEMHQVHGLHNLEQSGTIKFPIARLLGAYHGNPSMAAVYIVYSGHQLPSLRNVFWNSTGIAGNNTPTSEDVQTSLNQRRFWSCWRYTVYSPHILATKSVYLTSAEAMHSARIRICNRTDWRWLEIEQCHLISAIWNFLPSRVWVILNREHKPESRLCISCTSLYTYVGFMCVYKNLYVYMYIYT